MNKTYCQTLEGNACAAIVSRGGGARARKLTADALRAWRTLRDYERAKWFRRHAYFISGHLWKG